MNNIIKDNYDFEINKDKEFYALDKNYSILNDYNNNKLKEFDSLLEYKNYSNQTSSQQFTIIKHYVSKVLAPLKPVTLKPQSSVNNLSQTSVSSKVEMQETQDDIDDNKVRLVKKIFDFSDCNKELLDRSLEIIDLFEQCNIDLSSFLFYGVNTEKYESTWGTTLIELLNMENIETISNIWLYYRDYYFNPKNAHQSVKDFLEFISKFVDYPILLKNIVISYPNGITIEIKDSLDNLFNSKSFFNDDNKLMELNIEKSKLITIKDLNEAQSKIDDYIFELYLKREKKPLLGFSYAMPRFLKELFYLDYFSMDFLYVYGNSESLKMLEFNNRKNPEMVELIENMLVITDFIDSLNDEDCFYQVFRKLQDDRKYISFIRRIFSKYQAMMVRLYELESNYNLTNINFVIENGMVQGQKIGKTLGSYTKKVKALDLSNCKYTLYAHVMSSSEDIKELVEGKDGENKVFISLSPISHRMQVFYCEGITLAYDHIPEGNFILGSEKNVNSNSLIRDHSSDLKTNIDYIQKGILETSMAPSHFNAETVVLRSGLKPCGIIIPKGMEVTPEIIRYSLLYDLPLIFTQRPGTKIENPSEIEFSNTVENISKENVDDISAYLEDAKNIQIPVIKQSKQIGVITDLHGMYEPTLAILEDMRKKGITEIYSLGDNIGFGPNPHEVLELLREYNVKSIYGNHEIYVADGMDALSEHMATLSPVTVKKDKARTAWTRGQLTKQDIEDIMKYDSKIVVERGGKKITLVHSRKNDIYEKEGHFVKPEIDPSSIIIEGHEHFAHESNNVVTLRAAGMGFNYNDYGQAHYLIIEEDGSFNKVYVPYNINNFKESVNESTMGDEVRSTIDRFVRR